jgi:GTP-binding protein HflX
MSKLKIDQGELAHAISGLTVSEWGEPVFFQQAHLLPPNPEGSPYLIHPPMPWDKTDADLSAQTEALEEELARGETSAAAARIKGAPMERCLLIHVSSLSREEQLSSLEELKELARTAGLDPAGNLLQRTRGQEGSQQGRMLSENKLAELEVLALQGDAGLLIFDLELSPAQLAGLAAGTERTVIDRTQLILDIFASRAGSRAGKLQVELAQLQYRLPRLSRQNTAFDRLAGGIGGRGPGETKLETDRRRLRERISRIKEELKTLRRRRAFARTRRSRAGLSVVALVGYTNTGKSTLLNAMTGSNALAEDKLFATLDPCSRRLHLKTRNSATECILTDTVGFIRSLPKELLEAFQATLEELREADLLLHIADASHPELEKQVRSVEQTLYNLDLQHIPRLLILNKADLAEKILPPALRPDLHISARTGHGLPELSRIIIDKLKDL